MADIFGNGQGDTDTNFKKSSHKFVDPVRVFKANDPYHWTVDNIPIKQLQENVLWLKDQLSTDDISTSSGSRRAFDELKPTAQGSDRFIKVSPGNFIGRVNDAYNTGISRLLVSAKGDYSQGVYNTKESVSIDSKVLRRLIGETTDAIIGNNGLYDHLQHHTSNSTVNNIVDWGNFYTYDTKNDKSNDGILDIPKIKLALWQPDTTTHSYLPDFTGLQQRSTEWARAWGAPFRTSLVNIEKPLSIRVPEFDDSDYVKEVANTYVPNVRIDLLFIYTKPIDASSTSIAYPVGGSAASITEPQLGLVRGAGLISLKGAGGWTGKTIDKVFLDSSEYTDNFQDKNYWFEQGSTFDSDGNLKISSPITDQSQSLFGTSGVHGNFPSPDDLMNLAPYIYSEINNGTYGALVGQSVLPVAYIFVHKGETIISNNNILDIRPFFRTAELAYNERAGIAAANPPTSLANPVETSQSIGTKLDKLNSKIQTDIGNGSYAPNYPRPVGAGTIFGGIKYGVEGILVAMAQGTDLKDGSPFVRIDDPAWGWDNTNDLATNRAVIDNYFYNHLGYTAAPVNIPLDPDWDIADWAENIGGDQPGGSCPTDWINTSFVAAGQKATGGANFQNSFATPAHNLTYADDWLVNTAGGAMSRTPTEANKRPVAASVANTGSQLFYLKKRINLDKTQVSWMTDYEVILDYANCAPRSGSANPNLDSIPDPVWNNYCGLYVEKYPTFFNIICAYSAPNPNLVPDGTDAGNGNTIITSNQYHPQNIRNNARVYGGDWGSFASFAVTSDLHQGVQDQNTSLQSSPWGNLANNSWGVCLYPTIKFSVIGYPQGFKQEALGGNNPVLVLNNSI